MQVNLLVCTSSRLFRWLKRWAFIPARALCSLPKLWKNWEHAAGSILHVYVNLRHISLDSKSEKSLTSRLSVMLETCSRVRTSYSLGLRFPELLAWKETVTNSMNYLFHFPNINYLYQYLCLLPWKQQTHQISYFMRLKQQNEPSYKKYNFTCKTLLPYKPPTWAYLGFGCYCGVGNRGVSVKCNGGYFSQHTEHWEGIWAWASNAPRTHSFHRRSSAGGGHWGTFRKRSHVSVSWKGKDVMFTWTWNLLQHSKHNCIVNK